MFNSLNSFLVDRPAVEAPDPPVHGEAFGDEEEVAGLLEGPLTDLD